MAIPDYQLLMLPLLGFLKDSQEHSSKEVIDYISKEYNLSEEDLLHPLPSGGRVIDNRIGWARTYLKKAGLVDYPKRGYVKITERGLKVLNQNPQKIDVKFLEQFPEFKEFINIRKESDHDEYVIAEPSKDQTPDELMERGYTLSRDSLTQDIMAKLLQNDPYFFEELVLKLLSNMGYGEGKVTKRSGDGGFDGEINQDKLGLDKIFFQAKRFSEKNYVTPSMIRDFVGTLDLNGVNKGVFITTSKFSSEAKNTISSSHKRVVLIDGEKLVQLMIDYDLGVTAEKTYTVKKLDSDFFPE